MSILFAVSDIVLLHIATGVCVTNCKSGGFIVPCFRRGCQSDYGRVTRNIPTATGGFQGAEADLAPLPSQSGPGRRSWGVERAGAPDAPRGLRSGPGYAALVTSLIKTRAYAPLELASLWLRGC